MPNWVTNVITVDKRFEEIKAALESGTGADYSEIDFNNIIKMPEELGNVHSGGITIANNKSVRSWLESTVKISDVKYSPHPVIGFVTSDGWWFEKESEELRMLKEFTGYQGYPSWYEWCNANWGTKWNASDPYVEDGKFSFNTAWSAPIELFVEFSKRFPDVEFTYEYADEDTGNNCGSGTIVDGENMVEEYESGSNEAYELAFRLNGGEEYFIKNEDGNYVYFDGDEEDDEDDE
jgi:hypothetical protein